MPLKNITNTVAAPHGRGAKREQARAPKRTLSEAYEVDAEEMAAVKEEIYGRSQRKRKMFGWAKCPKFILDPLVERMMRMAGATKEDVFLDLGSGIGNVCQSVATMVGCRTVGIELTKENHNVAVDTAEAFHQYRADNQLTPVTTDFIQGDLRVHVPSLYKDATIVWCANLLFPLKLDCFLVYAFREFRPGTRIFVMKDIILHTDPYHTLQEGGFKYFTFEDFHWGPGDVEWTDLPGNLYMYTRTSYTGEDEDDE
eukprot:TRINITY_DN9561_c0_g1_i2.p1 TRINITY_DN9561_c0_g1~~TRINITY_DN9561_c0_g1_i2.p1  ORF type:complete len:255 (+),score=89.88 TRINITY_DN9561_c0_g1_i2:526-1290(+)